MISRGAPRENRAAESILRSKSLNLNLLKLRIDVPPLSPGTPGHPASDPNHNSADGTYSPGAGSTSPGEAATPAPFKEDGRARSLAGGLDRGAHRRTASASGDIHSEEGSMPNKSPRGPSSRRANESSSCDNGLDDKPVLVVEGLYIGSVNAEANIEALQKAGVKNIITVAGGHPPTHPEVFEYLEVHCRDRSDEDITKHFATCFDFIDKALGAKQGVLVHCVAGRSRSAAVVLGYMMYRKGYSLEAALSKLRSVRPCIDPNHGFLIQLLEFQQVGFDLQELARRQAKNEEADRKLKEQKEMRDKRGKALDTTV
eukprot:jgi/Mesvir1/17979/Mv09325-RA.1